MDVNLALFPKLVPSYSFSRDPLVVVTAEGSSGPGNVMLNTRPHIAEFCLEGWVFSCIYNLVPRASPWRPLFTSEKGDYGIFERHKCKFFRG